MSFLRFQGEGALCPFPLIVWSGCWVWCCECRRVVRPAVCAGACCASRRCFCAGACSDPPCARCLRAPAAPLALLAVPGVRGCAPLPPDPYPRQAELAGICALRARAALRAGVFLCWRMQPPARVRAPVFSRCWYVLLFHLFLLRGILDAWWFIW